MATRFTRPRRIRFIVSLAALISIWLIAGTHEMVRQLRAPSPAGIVDVGFTSRADHPTDQEVKDMVDEVIEQVYGEEGLSALLSPGDKVVIKVNIVEPGYGTPGEKGRGIITDPRIVRYFAEKVRDIIGNDAPADLKVVDAIFSSNSDPSPTSGDRGFYWARFERTGDATVDAGDACYDYDHNGILDGTSNATLVNTDAIGSEDRYITNISMPSLGSVDISMPKFLRTPEEAIAAGEPDVYCDVHIAIPVFKSHRMPGMTCAIKGSYGYCPEALRGWHAGSGMNGETPTSPWLMDDYIIAQHLVRSYEFVLLDCLTGNRNGPATLYFIYNDPVDMVFTHAMLASTDPIALDTVASQFAGYDPETVEFLEVGQIEGIGVADPAHIRVGGLTNFTEHRQFLLATAGGLYPFNDNIGLAQLMDDYNEPTNVTISEPVFVEGDTYSVAYTASEIDPDDFGLARIELLVDGELAVYDADEPSASGTIEVDLSGYSLAEEHTFQIAAWDGAFNCALSEEVLLQVVVSLEILEFELY